jgi:hypothetical protein
MPAKVERTAGDWAAARPAELRPYRVGRQVNSSKYEDADSIEPANPL